MTKKISLSLLAILISSCVLISAGLIAAAWFLIQSQKNYVPPSVELTETPTVDQQMDQIQDEVAEIRGLEMKTPLQRDMMTTDQLANVVINDFFADYSPEEAQDDVDLLSMIGLLNEDFDLLQFYKDLYSEQIAGYYDSVTKEMYVVSDGGFDGLARMTYAHEFTHVLQDQHYDLENGLKLNEENCEIDSEYCAAVSALVEGDATLAEQYWFLQKSTDQDKTEVSDFQVSYVSPVYDSAPHFMKQDFLFPYQQGMTFVNFLYHDKKWRSVDQAYENPPVSTEQILHPEKYPDDKPVEVPMPDLTEVLGPGWQELDRNTMGEWYSYLVLSSGINPQTRLNVAEAQTATEGWGGDTYVYYDHDTLSDKVFIWRSTWDSQGDAEEFFTSSRKYGNLRWDNPTSDSEELVTWNSNEDGRITIARSGGDVVWIIVKGQATYDKVWPLFTQFD